MVFLKNVVPRTLVTVAVLLTGARGLLASDAFTITAPLYGDAVTSCSDASMSSGTVDSQGILSTTPANQGTVATNGNLTLSGSSIVNGDVIVGPGKKVSMSGSAKVTGSTTVATSVFACAQIDLAALKTTLQTSNNNGQIPLTGQKKNPLSGTAFSMSGGDTLTLPAGTYYFTSFSMSGGSVITVSGPVHILCIGTVNLSGGSVAGQNGYAVHLWVSGTTVTVSSATLKAFLYAPSATVNLSSASVGGAIFANAVSISGSSHVTRLLDDVAPRISITSPVDSTAVPDPTHVLIKGTAADDETDVSVTVNGQSATIAADGTWQATVDLSASTSPATVTAVVTDLGGNTKTATIKVITARPAVTLASPAPGSLVATRTVNVAGTQDTATSVTVNGVPAAVATGTWALNGLDLGSDGTHTLTIVASNAVGATTITPTITTDTTGPAIVPSVTPPPNAAGWNNTNATVAFTCSDATSGVASCPSAVPVSTETAGQTVSATATDKAGNASNASVVVKLDKTPPAVTISTPNAGTIVTSSSITMSGSVSDALSGVVSVTCNGTMARLANGAFTCTPPLVLGDNTITVLASDAAGNVITSSVQVKYQPPPPQITISLPVNGAFENTTAVTVNGSAIAAAGISSVTVNGQPAVVNGNNWNVTLQFSGDGTKIITANVTDAAQQQASATTQFILDTTPPVMAIDPLPTGSWYSSTLIVEGHISDVLSGIGSLTCNGAPALLNNGLFNCTVGFVSGDNPVTIIGADVAGNTTTITGKVTYVPDNDPPTITYSITPQPSASGWLRQQATLSFTCTDAVSGVALCPTSSVVSGNGANQKFIATAIDNAGNEASVTISLNIDSMEPQIVIPSPPRLVRTPTLSISGTAHDGESGLATVACNGSVATLTADDFTCSVTLLRGINLVDVRATDAVGNSSVQWLTIELDDVPPSLTVDSPTDGTSLNSDSVIVSGSVSTDAVHLTVNGTTVVPTGTSFTTTVPVVDGTTSIIVIASDRAGNQAIITRSVHRYSVPTIAITSPTDLTVVGTPVVAVSGLTGSTTTVVDVNGVTAAPVGGTFTASVPLEQGRTVVTATARDALGRLATSTIFVYRDSIPPRVRLTWPQDGAVVAQPNITISGIVDDVVVGTVNASNVTVTVNGIAAPVSNRGFVLPFTLQAGLNTLTVLATDQAGNSASAIAHVTYTPSQLHATIVAGDNQTAPIGLRLSAPLNARLLDASNAPVPNAQLIFTVVQNDGTLTGSHGTARRVVEVTDAQGQASVAWTFGHRSGNGLQRVEVTAPGATPVDFVASATSGPPAFLVVDGGNGQFGAVSAPLPRPFIAIVTDAGYNRLSGVPVTFTVADGSGSFGGASSVLVTTDSDGRAIVRPTLGPITGHDNNVFVATTLGVNSTANFTASGLVAGAPAQTAITGFVLDHADLPIAGVTVRIVDTTMTTTTDAQGQFRFDAAPVGYVRLFVDGSTAQRTGAWPTLEFSLYTIAGQQNPVPMPIHLLPIDLRRGVSVDDTTGGTIALAELPGFSLTIKPGSATFPGGGRTGTVSATLVHFDKVPMPPAVGEQPRFVVTVQPPGVHFDPPAPMTYPNLDGLPPGTITELYSFDHDLGQFVPIGTGSVSEDATTIRSDFGVGLIKGGWQYTGPPAPVGTAGSISVNVHGEFHNFDPNTVTNQPVHGTQRRIGAPRAAATTSAVTDDVVVGSSYDFVADGHGPQSSGYQWEIIDDPADPNDDPTCGHLVTTPQCAGADTCRATVFGDHPGILSIQIVYRNDATGAEVKKIAKVRFVQVTLSIKSIDFGVADDSDPPGPMLTLFKDIRATGTTPASANAITSPQWIAPDINGTTPQAQAGTSAPLLYVRNQTMSANVVVTVQSVQPPGGVHQLVLEGEVIGFGKFKSRPVDLSDSGDSTIAVKMDTRLPNTTRYYNPMSVVWEYLLGSQAPNSIGLPTENEVFVALQKPLTNRHLYLSSVKLALANSQETDPYNAFLKTWAAFAGPANIQTWDKKPIAYYAAPFSASLSCPQGSDDEGSILMNAGTSSSSQCSGLASVLAGALAVNGFRSERISAVIPQRGFLVPNWNFGNPSMQTTAGTAVYGYNWKMIFSNAALSSNAGLSLSPPPDKDHPTIFGDLENKTGIPGQNTTTPVEKVFGNHVFILPHIVDSNGSPITVPGPYYDPSYGVTYTDASGFEGSAVAGYVSPPVRGIQPPNARLVKKRTTIEGLVQFCKYATAVIDNNGNLTTCETPTVP